MIVKHVGPNFSVGLISPCPSHNSCADALSRLHSAPYSIRGTKPRRASWTTSCPQLALWAILPGTLNPWSKPPRKTTATRVTCLLTVCLCQLPCIPEPASGVTPAVSLVTRAFSRTLRLRFWWPTIEVDVQCRRTEMHQYVDESAYGLQTQDKAT